MPQLDPYRIFSSEVQTRKIAAELYDTVKSLPIVSPHGHTDPRWFAENEAFANPAQLFVTPDHYVFRMLHSQGVALESLGVPLADGSPTEQDGRKIWQLFADNYYLLRGTPSRMWLDHAFAEVFGIKEEFTPATAKLFYDRIDDCLKQDEFKPRALFERFNIELIATTESPLDDLRWHKMIKDSGWSGRVVTAYRPDAVVDPEHRGFLANVKQFGEVTGEDTNTWQGYLAAHINRRAFFKAHGATSSDHGHPTPRTENLSPEQAEALFLRVIAGDATAEESDAFRGQMLTEMARMSVQDGLVLQIHPGSSRNHNAQVFDQFGADKGFDIPKPCEYVQNLKPLLNAFGSHPELTIIVFTLDESTQSRELAPLAGVYPALRLGPPWWFFDSVEGMRRFRQNATETAGFYNTVGFNDDTRAFCSIPARHDVARRVDSTYLAELVTTGRLSKHEAHEVIVDLSYKLVKDAYRL